MKKLHSALCVAVGFLLVSFCSIAHAGPAVGQTAPALRVSTLAGEAFDLGDLRGKVVIVNFWATWCSPCRQEMPALSAFYQKHHAQGVEMIGLSVDQGRDRKDVRKVAKTVAYPVALASDARTNGFGDADGLPITCVIDSAGVIRAVFHDKKGAVTEQSLETVVTPLLPDSHK